MILDRASLNEHIKLLAIYKVIPFKCQQAERECTKEEKVRVWLNIEKHLNEKAWILSQFPNQTKVQAW